MSLAFNDTTNFKGIVQEYESEIGVASGFISGNTERLKKFTVQANLAWDDFLEIAFGEDGTWQMDDSNHTDYPIITTNLVSGQRDYPFTTDGSGNLILDIFKVMVADSTGRFCEVKPVDVQSQQDTAAFYDGQNSGGVPTRYDKTANGIFLDLVPNYNYTNGLKIYINREPSYFVYGDTTKKPGVPGLFHRWFVVRPAENYGRRKVFANYPAIQTERIELQAKIKSYFSRRPKDERPTLVPMRQNNK